MNFEMSLEDHYRYRTHPAILANIPLDIVPPPRLVQPASRPAAKLEAVVQPRQRLRQAEHWWRLKAESEPEEREEEEIEDAAEEEGVDNRLAGDKRWQVGGGSWLSPEQRRQQHGLERLKQKLDLLIDQHLSEDDKLNLSFYLNEFETNSCDLSELLTNLLENLLIKLPNPMIKYKLLSYIKRLYIENNSNQQQQQKRRQSDCAHGGSNPPPTGSIVNGWSANGGVQFEGKHQLDLRLFEAMSRRYLVASSLLMYDSMRYTSDSDLLLGSTVSLQQQQKRRRQRRAAELQRQSMANDGSSSSASANKQTTAADRQRNLRCSADELDARLGWPPAAARLQTELAAEVRRRKLVPEEEDDELALDGQLRRGRQQQQRPRRRASGAPDTSGRTMDTSGSPCSTMDSSGERRAATFWPAGGEQLSMSLDSLSELRLLAASTYLAPDGLLEENKALPTELCHSSRQLHHHHRHHRQQQHQRRASASANQEEPDNIYTIDGLLLRSNLVDGLETGPEARSRSYLPSQPSSNPKQCQRQRSTSQQWLMDEEENAITDNDNSNIIITENNNSNQSLYLPNSAAPLSSYANQAHARQHHFRRLPQSAARDWPTGASCGELAALAPQASWLSRGPLSSTQAARQSFGASSPPPSSTLAAGQSLAARSAGSSSIEQLLNYQRQAPAAATSYLAPSWRPYSPLMSEQLSSGARASERDDEDDDIGWTRSSQQPAAAVNSIGYIDICQCADCLAPLSDRADFLQNGSPHVKAAPPTPTGSLAQLQIGRTSGGFQQQRCCSSMSVPFAPACQTTTATPIWQQPARLELRPAATATTTTASHSEGLYANYNHALASSLPSSPIANDDKFAQSPHQQQPQPLAASRSKSRRHRRHNHHNHHNQLQPPSTQSKDYPEDSASGQVSLVPAQAKGRLSASVAEQMEEQASNFVAATSSQQLASIASSSGSSSQHNTRRPSGKRAGSAGSSLPTDRKPSLQVRRTLRVKIRKSKPILGIAIEGGFNVSGQLLPRIVCVHEDGAAYQCGKLRASDLILEVNGKSTVNMTHDEIAKTIATAYYQDPRAYIEFLIGESVHV